MYFFRQFGEILLLVVEFSFLLDFAFIIHATLLYSLKWVISHTEFYNKSQKKKQNQNFTATFNAMSILTPSDKDPKALPTLPFTLREV